MNTQTMMKQFKEDLSLYHKIDLDFRRHVYVDNSFGLYPVYSYNLAEEIVTYLYAWAGEFIAEHELDTGFDYNLMMTVDQLRSTRLKDHCNYVFEQLCGHYNEKCKQETK